MESTIHGFDWKWHKRRSETPPYALRSRWRLDDETHRAEFLSVFVSVLVKAVDRGLCIPCIKVKYVLALEPTWTAAAENLVSCPARQSCVNLRTGWTKKGQGLHLRYMYFICLFVCLEFSFQSIVILCHRFAEKLPRDYRMFTLLHIIKFRPQQCCMQSNFLPYISHSSICIAN